MPLAAWSTVLLTPLVALLVVSLMVVSEEIPLSTPWILTLTFLLQLRVLSGTLSETLSGESSRSKSGLALVIANYELSP